MLRSRAFFALLSLAALSGSPALFADDDGIPMPAGAQLVDQRAAEKEMEALGELRGRVLFWLSLDSAERGGVAWSHTRFNLNPTYPLIFREQGGRKYAEFRKQGALLRFEKPLTLSKSYTLCTWLQLPMPKKHGIVWQGAGVEGKNTGAMLTVTDKEIYGWSEKAQAKRLYGALPEGTKGWHHVAITVDAGVTTAYLDGKELGRVQEEIATTISTIGGHWHQPHQHWMMCDGLDEQFYFRGALSVEEIKKVMTFKPPKEQPKMYP